MNGDHNPERLATIETKRQQVEDQLYLRQTLPDKIGASVAKELSKITLNVTETIWTQPITIDLSIARTTGVPFGTYPEGDCIVYLPDSNGIVTVRLDNPTAHGYQMGTYYFKLRAPFHTLYIENTAQSGFCYLQIGKGNITVERITTTVTIDSTTTPLGVNAPWTSSSWFDAISYGFISVLASADVTGTLYLQHSNDGVNIHGETRAITTLTTLSTGATLWAATIMSARPARYVRPAFVNGAVAHSSFSLTALARVTQ